MTIKDQVAGFFLIIGVIVAGIMTIFEIGAEGVVERDLGWFWSIPVIIIILGFAIGSKSGTKRTR